MFVEVTVTHILNKGVGFFPQSPEYKLYVNGDHIVKFAKKEDEERTVMTLSDGVVYAISETPHSVANKLNGGED